MNAEQARTTLADANTRMMVLAEQMEQLRAQQLAILRQAQAIADEEQVREAIRTVGLYPTTANRRYLYVLEGAGVIQSLRLGKQKHIRELAFPICEAGDWAASRPAYEAWLVASAPLINASELFNEPKRVTFLGI